MSSMRILLPVLLAGASAFSAVPAAASCKMNYGKRLLDWADNDAARQSRALAESDYRTRSYNSLLLGFDNLHARATSASAALDAVDAAIAAVEAEIAQIEAGTGPDRETARAIMRDASAAQLTDGLIEIRRQLADIARLRTAMMADPTKGRFLEDGLQNVGRATLLASLQEMGDFTRLGLADRYSFAVGVTVSDDGQVTDAQIIPNGEWYDAVATALSKLAPEPYGYFGLAVYSMARMGLHQHECAREQKRQNAKVSKASKRIGEQLIGESEQFPLFDRLYRAERDKFTDNVSGIAGIETALLDRWRQTFALNLSRAASARTILTTARVAAVRARAGADPSMASLFDNLGRAAVARDIARLAGFEAESEQAAAGACLSVEGLTALESNEDAIAYAEEIYATFDKAAAFVTLQPLIEAREAASADSAARAAQRRIVIAAGGCANLAAPAVIPARLILGAGPSQAQVNPDTALIAIRAAPRASTGVSGPALAKWAAIAHANAAPGFCVMVRQGGVDVCDNASGGGIPYADEFAAGPDPRAGVLQRANDGGYRSDARIAAGIEGVRANIDTRIAETNRRVAGAIAAFPAWRDINLRAEAAREGSERQAAVRTTMTRTAFEAATAPASEAARAELATFLQSPADPANANRLMRSIGMPDPALPDLPVASVPPLAPEVRGITAQARVYGTLISGERDLAHRRAQAARDLSARPVLAALAAEALDMTRFIDAPESDAVAAALRSDVDAMRLYARGKLPALEMAVIGEDGAITRVPVFDPEKPPENTVLMRARAYRGRQMVLHASVATMRTHFGSLDSVESFRIRALDLGASIIARTDAGLFGLDLATLTVVQDMTTSLLDLGLSASPYSWPKDFYEAVAGANLITGEPLDTIGRTAAVIGALTFGSGDVAFRAISAIRKLGGSDALEHYRRVESAASAIGRTTWFRTTTHADQRFLLRFSNEADVVSALESGKRWYDVQEDSVVCVELFNKLHPERQRAWVAVSLEGSIKTVQKGAANQTDRMIGEVVLTAADGSKHPRYLPLLLVPPLP